MAADEPWGLLAVAMSMPTGQLRVLVMVVGWMGGLEAVE